VTLRAVTFTRPTIIAAVELFGARSGQAHFNSVVLRLGLENEIAPDLGLAVAKKANALGRIVVQQPAEQVETIEGAMSFGGSNDPRSGAANPSRLCMSRSWSLSVGWRATAM
jgi:hypothetical protein